MIRKLGVVLVLAAGLLIPGADAAHATSFAPTTSAALSDSAPGANASITTTFTLGINDSMFETLVTFIPPEFGVATGDSVTDGAVVGSINSQMTLGLIGSACNQVLEPEWLLLDGSTNIADTVSFEDVDHDGFREFFEDENLDNLYDGVTKYPEPLTRIFPGLTPRERIFGLTPVAGIPVLLNILIFEPGTDVLGYTLDPTLGYPAVVVFFDHGDPQTIPEPGAITDWCAPLLVRTDVEGVTLNNPDTPANEAGQVYRTNPAVSGTYPFGTFAVSLPDADNDGYENQLDTCPLAPNAGNPKLLNSGDQDFDGLDAACDPNDDPGTGGTNSDEDGDGYLNRQDNCPLVQNGPLEANQIDTDRDGIGDHCDVNPYNADGHRHMVCLIDHVEVGAGGGTPPQLPLPCDADNDGVPDNYDNCPTVANTAGQADDVDGDLAGDACDAPGTGNVDCSQAVNSVDALKTLRHSAGLSVAQSEPCLDIGMMLPSGWAMGDVNCSGGGTPVNAVDGLLILRANAGLPVNIPVGCPEIKPP